MYKFYSYSMLRTMIKNGDTIAVNGNSLISKAIKFITKENISHTGIALWQDDRLFVVEMDMDKNVMVPLSQYEHNELHVYRHKSNIEISSNTILDLLKQPVNYGWIDIVKLFGYKTLGVSFLTKDTTNAMICTSLNQKCYKQSNIDITEGLITPGELCAQLELIGRV